MSTSLDLRGDFWLESTPTHRVPGHLRFDPKHHGSLSLHGELRPGRPRSARRESYERIHGDILGRACLLTNSFSHGESSALGRPGEWDTYEQVFVNEVLLYPKTDTGAPASRFIGASFRVRGLTAFDGRNPFLREADDGSGHEHVVAAHLEDRRVGLEFGELLIQHGLQTGLVALKSRRVASRHFVNLRFAEALDLERVLDLVGKFRTILALVMHQDCRFRGPIELYADPSLTAASEDDRGYEFHAVWSRGFNERGSLYNRVFSYDELTPGCINAWMSLDDNHWQVVDRLASLRFSGSLTFDDAIVRVVAAADSLHRTLTGERFERLERVLAHLLDHAGPTFEAFIPRRQDWISAIVEARHNAAHNKGLPQSRPALASELIYSVYWLVFFGLLRQVGAPEASFEAAKRSQPFAWPMNEIRKDFQA